jgi:hypothetical protein
MDNVMPSTVSSAICPVPVAKMLPSAAASTAALKYTQYSFNRLPCCAAASAAGLKWKLPAASDKYIPPLDQRLLSTHVQHSYPLTWAAHWHATCTSAAEISGTCRQP